MRTCAVAARGVCVVGGGLSWKITEEGEYRVVTYWGKETGSTVEHHVPGADRSLLNSERDVGVGQMDAPRSVCQEWL